MKLRPFIVNTEAHVKAVYTICILAYFINRYLANQRKSIDKKDSLNSKELYAPFRDIDIATLEDCNTGHSLKKQSSCQRVLRPRWRTSHCLIWLRTPKNEAPRCVVTENSQGSSCYHYYLCLESGT